MAKQSGLKCCLIIRMKTRSKFYAEIISGVIHRVNRVSLEYDLLMLCQYMDKLCETQAVNSDS